MKPDERKVIGKLIDAAKETIQYLDGTTYEVVGKLSYAVMEAQDFLIRDLAQELAENREKTSAAAPAIPSPSSDTESSTTSLFSDEESDRAKGHVNAFMAEHRTAYSGEVVEYLLSVMNRERAPGDGRYHGFVRKHMDAMEKKGFCSIKKGGRGKPVEYQWTMPRGQKSRIIEKSMMVINETTDEEDPDFGAGYPESS